MVGGPNLAKVTFEYKNGLTTTLEGEALAQLVQDWAIQAQAKAVLDQLNANAEAQRVEAETGGKVVSLAQAVQKKNEDEPV
jgi:hypothetical protein